METWHIREIEILKYQLSRHEAGHALAALLEDQPLYGYKAPVINIVERDENGALYDVAGHVNLGHEVETIKPDSLFRIVMAGPASEPIFKSILEQPRINDEEGKSDLLHAEDTIEQIAKDKNTPLSRERANRIINTMQKKMFRLFKSSTVYYQAIEIITDLFTMEREITSDMQIRILQLLKVEGINIERIENMRRHFRKKFDLYKVV